MSNYMSGPCLLGIDGYLEQFLFCLQPCLRGEAYKLCQNGWMFSLIVFS